MGQGDAALIQFPHGKTMLIDAGGGIQTYNMGQRVLFHELTRLGILHLDYLVLTHPDQDHSGGLFAILEQFSVGEFWWNAQFGKNSSPQMKEILEKIREKGIQSRGFLKFYQQKIGSTAVDIFPPRYRGEKREESNNRSLVIHFEYQGCRFLFTGDIHKEVERQLMNVFSAVSLLKVAHHGSRTSSSPEFLRHFSPRWMLVSAGLDNRHRHPHLEVLRNLRQTGGQIFRTDFHGAVRFIIQEDGRVDCHNIHGSCGRSFCENGSSSLFSK